jgi:hypothetical protein
LEYDTGYVDNEPFRHGELLVKGLLQDTGDEDLQMLERGATLNCRGLETRRIQAVFEVDRPW